MTERAAGNWIKRAMDVVMSVIGLFVLSPLLGVVALAIRYRMGSPVLFRQPRPGLNGRPFVLVKFRTMREPMPTEQPVVEQELVTGLGSFLRLTSIDELPQFWNILKGDMSMVGPRPLAMEYLPRYTPEQARRHTVRPGLTGWAQVHGRHMLSWEERFTLDVWYVDHWSLWLDIRVLFMTVLKVFQGAGKVPPATADFGSVDLPETQARARVSASESHVGTSSRDTRDGD